MTLFFYNYCMNTYNGKIMKKLVYIGFLCISLMFVAGCKAVFPAPVSPISPSIDDSVFSAPKNVQASNGLQKKIVLSWDDVALANYYYIYMADSPDADFKQVNETKSNTITLKVPEGTTKYYKVCSVNSSNVISEGSLIVSGSSLATPMITSIDEAENKTTVYWYMENLSTATYGSNVEFIIHCNNVNGTEDYTTSISNTCDTFFTFDNLTPDTSYIYYIEAIVSEPTESKETSSKVTSITKADISDIPVGPVMKKLIKDTSFEIADLTNKDSETKTETIKWEMNEEETEITDETVLYYEVQIKNLNCSDKWYPVAKISADGKSVKMIDTIPDWADIKVWGKIADHKACFEPNNFNTTTGFHNGLLKVLRDYRHYYRFIAKDKNDNVLKTIENDEKYCSYRQISNEEFAKCAALNIADSMHQAKGNSGTFNGSSGKLEQSWTFSSDYWTYTYTGFVNNFRSLPGSTSAQNSFMKLQCGKSQNGRAYSNYVYGLGLGTIYITNPTINLPSYSGVVTLSGGTTTKKETEWTVILTAKNDVMLTEKRFTATQNEAECKAIFPFLFGYKLTNSGLSYPTMQNEWWEARD